MWHELDKGEQEKSGYTVKLKKFVIYCKKGGCFGEVATLTWSTVRGIFSVCVKGEKLKKDDGMTKEFAECSCETIADS